MSRIVCWSFWEW